ncbi:C2H2-type domain-containing protein [Plasmodiophora brassicae]|uniref:C2H2-type domain-containing protein n=1 Tax=Plasmodiophora brassicae TaxID=37360 RepID=A0A0G4IN31_PLABS|nr:hypothetical protein PBRA_005307 [Plasmodiophora brassicae]SPQ95367.1 unnamed protein product [Plasmodiophora brassicae]
MGFLKDSSLLLAIATGLLAFAVAASDDGDRIGTARDRPVPFSRHQRFAVGRPRRAGLNAVSNRAFPTCGPGESSSTPARPSRGRPPRHRHWSPGARSYGRHVWIRCTKCRFTFRHLPDLAQHLHSAHGAPLVYLDEPAQALESSRPPAAYHLASNTHHRSPAAVDHQLAASRAIQTGRPDSRSGNSRPVREREFGLAGPASSSGQAVDAVPPARPSGPPFCLFCSRTFNGADAEKALRAHLRGECTPLDDDQLF